MLKDKSFARLVRASFLVLFYGLKFGGTLTLGLIAVISNEGQ